MSSLPAAASGLRALHMGLLRVLAVSLLVMLISGLVYAGSLYWLRPLDIVEGEVLFEASRLRDGLSLWTDPLTGAYDYGPVPARFYVLYTPVWPLLLSLVPASVAPYVGRALATASFYGVLALAVARSPRPNMGTSALVAAYVGGTFMLVRAGVNGTADALAVACAGVALLRATKRGTLDVPSALLFACAAWIKPNVLGMALGVFPWALFSHPRRAVLPVLAAVGLSGLLAGVLEIASGGSWLGHLVRSTGQPLDAALWVRQVVPRLPFLGLPHAVVLAALLVYRRRVASPVPLAALVGSLAWTLLSMGKVGSATHYWLEPSIAMLVGASTLPLPSRAEFGATGGRWTLVGWGGLALLAVSLSILNARAVAVAVPALRAAKQELVQATGVCSLGPSGVALGEHPGIEVTLNGRLITTPYQTSHLMRAGAFPMATWIADVDRPEVQCLVMESDLLERPLSDEDPAGDRFNVSMRRELRERFVLVSRGEQIWVYRKRP